MNIGEAVAKFSNEVDEAVSRARRAAAEAREQSSRFRKEPPASGSAETDPSLRSDAVRFRTRAGLPVADEPVPAPPVPQSSDDDDDFSQEQIMERF